MGGRDQVKVGVDTNILVRMFTRDHPQESPKAEAFLREHDIVVGNQTLCELLWVLRRLYKFNAAELRQAITYLTLAQSVTLDSAAVTNGLLFMDAGGDFADGVIAYEGRRLGSATIATFDRKAAALLEKAGQDCLLLSAG
jgi:predicted nucleic-acid-binding protein